MSDVEISQSQLQNEISKKKEELVKLRQELAVAAEKAKQEELNKQITDLEKQITELTTKLNDLKSTIDTIAPDKEATYKIIQGTEMEKRLKDAGKTDIEVKEFAEKIDTVVRKFLDKELIGFSNKIKNPMCIGIQFAMMETLTKQPDAADFFTTFSKTDLSSSGSAFMGFLETFTKGVGSITNKIDNGNEFFKLARKVQNITQFIKLKKEIINQPNQSIPELMNPFKFKQILENTIRDDYQNIYKETPMALFHFGQSEGVNLSPEEEQALKIIAGNAFPAGMKAEQIDKIVSSIEKALGTADKFLDIRDKYSKSATSLFDKIAPILNINIPFIGTLGGLIGVNRPADLLGKDRKKKRPVMDFILNVFGFSGGVEGLHMKYVMEHYDALLSTDQKGIIKNAYNYYQSNLASQTVQNNDDPNSIYMKFQSTFGSLEETQVTLLKQKLPPSYDLLKSSVTTLLGDSTLKLSPTIIGKIAPEAIVKDAAGNLSVDMAKITDKAVFAEKYLQYMIPEIVKLGPNFIASDKITGPNEVVLGILGALVGERYFLEAMNIGAVAVTDFGAVTPTSTTTENTGQQNPEQSSMNMEGLTGNEKLSSLTFEQAKSFAYAIFGHGAATELLIKLSKGSPAMILRVIALGRHEGALLFGRKNLDPTPGHVNISTFQISSISEADVVKKYNDTLEKGKALLDANTISYSADDFKGIASYDQPTGSTVYARAQKDLLSWLGFVQAKVSPTNNLFDQLADTTLSDADVQALMSRKIQVGVDTIGIGVVKQIKENTTSMYLDLVAKQIGNTPNRAPESTEQQKTEYKNTTFFVGDSLTVGYAINLGFKGLSNMGGKQTPRMKNNLIAYLNNPNTVLPKTLFLLGGVNDLCSMALVNFEAGKTKYTAQDMSDRIFTNLKAMKDAAEAKGITCVVGTVAPFATFIERQRYRSQAKEALTALSFLNARIKRERPDNTIDFYSELADPNKPGYLKDGLSADGIHPGNGYKKMQEMAFVKRQHINKVKGIEVPEEQLKKNIQDELASRNSPLTADMVIQASRSSKVPVEYIMTFMLNDSAYGTAGRGAVTYNPGNVGNTATGTRNYLYKNFKDGETVGSAADARQLGVNAVAENLKRRIDEYQKVYGASKLPTVRELADNIGPDGKGFISNQGNYKQPNSERLGAYMSGGGKNIPTINDSLVAKGITNREQIMTA